MTIPYNYQDDKLKQARQGFQVVPNQPEPVFKPNVFAKGKYENSGVDADAIPQNTGDQDYGTVQSGNRDMVVMPGGTITNFPTDRDIVSQQIPLDAPMDNSGIVNKALQPQIQATTPPAQPVIVPGMSRNEQFAQSQQWQRDYTNQIKQTRMLGRDPTEWTTQEVQHGSSVGGIPDVQVRRKTPAEKAQDWESMNVMATASVGAVGKDGRPQPVASPTTIFTETAHKHADSWFYDTAPDKADNRDMALRLNYKQASKPIQDQIIRAAITHPKFQNKEDIQSFIQGLGIDERFGQLAENTMTSWLEKANPDLLASIRGDQEVQRANDQVIINFVRQHSTAQGADQMSNEQALTAAKSDPALMQQIRREGILMVQDPITHKPIAPQQTEEEKTERKSSAQTKEWRLLKEYNDAFAKAHPDFASRLNPTTGEPQLMAKEELQKEQNKAAMERQKEERATQAADIQALQESRAAKKAELEETPKYKEAMKENIIKDKMREARSVLIERQYAANQVLEEAGKLGKIKSKDGKTLTTADEIYEAALDKLEKDPRYLPTPEPGTEPTTPPLPPPPQIGEVRKGYQYKGGDPKQESSWTQQVSPATSALPYISPVTQRENIVNQIPVAPVPVAAPVAPALPQNKTPPQFTNEDVIKFASGIISNTAGEVRDTIKGVQEKVVDAVVAAKVRQLSNLPAVKIAQYETELGKSVLNKLLAYGRRKMMEEWQRQQVKQ